MYHWKTEDIEQFSQNHLINKKWTLEPAFCPQPTASSQEKSGCIPESWAFLQMSLLKNDAFILQS